MPVLFDRYSAVADGGDGQLVALGVFYRGRKRAGDFVAGGRATIFPVGCDRRAFAQRSGDIGRFFVEFVTLVMSSPVSENVQFSGSLTV